MLDPTLAADGLRRVSQTKTSDVLVMLEDFRPKLGFKFERSKFAQ